MKDALLLFRKMVADGLVDPQSWEMQNGDDARNKFVAGETCALIFNGGGHIGRIQNDMDLAGQGAQEWLLPAPVLEPGSTTRGYTTEPRFWSGTFITQLPGNNPMRSSPGPQLPLEPRGSRADELRHSRP